MDVEVFIKGQQSGEITEDELYGWLLEYLNTDPSPLYFVLATLDPEVRERFKKWLKLLTSDTVIFNHGAVIEPSKRLLNATSQL